MTLQRLILTSRPIMWPFTALMFLVGIGNFSNFSVLSAVELVLFTFPLNFYLYGLNDLYDTGSDRINSRKDGVQGLTPKDTELPFLARTTWIAPAVFFLATLVSRNIEHILLGLLFVLLCFTYSQRTIRFKEIPILDCFNSAAIYCLPGLIAYSLHASILTLPIQIFFLILPYMGIHAITTLLDEEADAKAGMTTIAVAFGKTGTTLFSLALFLVSLAVFRHNFVIASALVIGIFFQIVFLAAGKKEDVYFRFGLGATIVSLGMLCLVYYILQWNI